CTCVCTVTVWRSVTPGFSTRQVEGLRGTCLIQRKVDFHFLHLFVRSILGPGAWRFQSDLGGMKSPILGPGFGNGQDTDCSGVHGSFVESGPGFWAPPQQTGVRRAPPRQTGGLCLGVRRASP
ncbi:unnamed protein product, partial [Staurois parvus]